MACRFLVMGMADRVSMANATQVRQAVGVVSSLYRHARPSSSQKKMGQERSSLAQSRHAGGGLPDNCALLQSAVEIPETDAGQ